MKSVLNNFLLVLISMLYTFSWTTISAVEINQSQTSSKPLQVRWEEGLTKARETALSKGFWLGYSIQKLMGEDSYIGNFRKGSVLDKPTLEEIIYGEKKTVTNSTLSANEEIRLFIQEELQRIETTGKQEEKVQKSVALLYLFKDTELQDVKISNLSLPVDLKDKPLIWIGSAGDEESIEIIKKIYEDQSNIELKEDLVTAAAIHQNQKLTVPFLKNVLVNEKDSDVREKTAFWMGQQNTLEALNILKNVTEKDPASAVRENALFGISQMHIPEALDVLTHLAKNSTNQDVQEKAIFWLGQSGSEKAFSILEQIAFSNSPVDIKEKAIFGLAQLQTDNALQALINIAQKHPEKDVRSKAIFWLGQKASKKAFDSLENVLYRDEDTEVQEQALFAISQLPKDQALPKLEKVVKNHPNYQIRKKAIFWLGQIDDPKAVEVLVKFLEKE
jgi:HEAT repeat protein